MADQQRRNEEIAKYCAKYPRVPKRYFKNLVKNLDPEEIPQYAGVINTRLVYGQETEHMDTPVCCNIDSGKELIDVIPSIPEDVLNIVCKFSEMTQDDVEMELLHTVGCDSLLSTTTVTLRRSFNWHLILQVSNREKREDVCKIHLTPWVAHIDVPFGTIHILDLKVADIKNQVIHAVLPMSRDDSDLVPIIAHMICLWRSYTM